MKIDTIHFVYVKNKKIIQNPFSIGNHLYAELKKKYKVKFYRWDVAFKIKPSENDILIGHSHPNPFTVFRLSMKNNLWKKIILLQPFTTNIYQVGFLLKVLPYCDKFIAICGNYWFDKIRFSYFRKWLPIMTQQDMAINQKNYPFLKKNFNKKNKRKFLYIGNNADEKNLEYLKYLANKTNHKNFATIGAKIEGLTSYGYLDLKKNKSKKIIAKYDFLILTSKYDANPTVVLEAISFGLIPIVTPECGFSDIEGIINLKLNNHNYNVNLIDDLQNLSEIKLKKIQHKGQKIIKKSSWKNFCKKVIFQINSTKNFKINDFKIEKLGYEKFKKSNHYHLRMNNIFRYIKSNLKFFFMKAYEK
jgi:glycosyltransferase involved in cell wall biosynthesis